MTNDFSGFTPRAHKVVSILSQQEARRLFSDELKPEHVFLGLLREPEGAATRALGILGLDLDDLRREVEIALKNRSSSTITLGGIPLSARVKSVLEASKREAGFIGHNYVGTEHLLLGIAVEENPEAVLPTIFTNRNISINAIRAAVIKAVGYGENTEGIKTESKKKATKTPFMNKFSQDITAMARDGELDPVIGRSAETKRLIQILCRRQKNNPILIGEPGVGKTAIVEGVAQMIVDGNVPEKMLENRILLLDLGQMVAGTKYRGEFEERMKNIIKEAESCDDVILFIDEIHTILGAGNAEGALDASNMLKPALARGLIRCIGATTFEEYKKRIEKDKALVRRFQPITVEEPTLDETIEILMRIKSRYEDFHFVDYTQEAIRTAAALSARYIHDRHLPDKAIDVIDEAGAASSSELAEKPADILLLEEQIAEMEETKENVVKDQQFERAIEIRDQIKRLKDEYDQKKSEWMSAVKNQRILITHKEIEKTVSEISGIPVNLMDDGENLRRYLEIDQTLKEHVKGQDEAVRLISEAIKKSAVGLRDHKKPIANFIFLGPTGVGKTLLAKTLARFLFGSEETLIRVDMSEYMESFNVSRLVGAPPGYVGHESGGELTDKVRQKPYSVVLFDEIEKANPDVFNLFLQILDEGQVTDSLGNHVNFQNTVVIFTSNLGTERLSHKAMLGFSDEAHASQQKKDFVVAELKKHFRPEFLNRIDETVVFEQLGGEVIKEIFDTMIEDINESLNVRGMKLKISKKVRDFVISEGFEEAYGARSLRRAISRMIEIPASEKILKEGLHLNPEEAMCEITASLTKSNKMSFKFKNHILPKKETKKSEKSSRSEDCPKEQSCTH